MLTYVIKVAIHAIVSGLIEAHINVSLLVVEHVIKTVVRFEPTLIC